MSFGVLCRHIHSETNVCFLSQVLLVSSSRHPDQWIVPGGGMEPEEDPCGAAVREVFEEVTNLEKSNFDFSITNIDSQPSSEVLLS